MSGSQRSLGKGSAAPGPVPEGLIRLYSMRFCPFAQRPRLVLAAKGIEHEVININLKNKPDWFFEKSPLGLVPSLETPDGKIIYESPIVCDYLDEAYPGKKLTPTDPYKKAQEKMLLELFSGVTTALYKIVYAKRANEDLTEVKAQFFEKLKKLEEALAKRGGPYFGGQSVSMADYMIWPWFERLSAYDLEETLSLHSNVHSEVETEANISVGLLAFEVNGSRAAVIQYGHTINSHKLLALLAVYIWRVFAKQLIGMACRVPDRTPTNQILMAYPGERQKLVDASSLHNSRYLEKVPHISAWQKLMLQDPAVKETFTEPDVLLGFANLYAKDSVDAVDYGLD